MKGSLWGSVGIFKSPGGLESGYYLTEDLPSFSLLVLGYRGCYLALAAFCSLRIPPGAEPFIASFSPREGSGHPEVQDFPEYVWQRKEKASGGDLGMLRT